MTRITETVRRLSDNRTTKEAVREFGIFFKSNKNKKAFKIEVYLVA